MGFTTSNKCTIVAADGLITSVGNPTGLNSGSQKNDGVTVDASDLTHIVFDAQVDNKKQSSVATDWNKALGNTAAHMYSYQLVGTNSNLPDKLNFYFQFSMTCGGQDYQMYLGQGSYQTSPVTWTNNWWIGCNPNMHSFYQGEIGGISFASICLLSHSTGGLLSLPSVNYIKFGGASSLTITHLEKSG